MLGSYPGSRGDQRRHRRRLEEVLGLLRPYAGPDGDPVAGREQSGDDEKGSYTRRSARRPTTAATMSPNARNSGAPGTPVPARRGPFTCAFGLGLGAGLSVVFEPRTTGREAAREVSTQQSA